MRAFKIPWLRKWRFELRWLVVMIRNKRPRKDMGKKREKKAEANTGMVM